MSADGTAVDHEYVLPEGEVLVKRIDLDGRITYANQGFLDASGYTLDECMGQMLSNLRHPDMPQAVYTDLWRTIRGGRPWTGLVKNQRKGGGCFWARANVSPIVDADRITGYMSVWVRPARADVLAAEPAYRGLRSGARQDITILDGQVVRAGWLASLARFARPSVTAAVRMGATALAALFLTIALLGGGAAPAYGGLLLALSLTGLAVTVLFAGFLTARVSAPLRAAATTAGQIVGGDVRRQYADQGAREVRELCRILNQTNAKLVGVLIDATYAIDSVVHGARDIAGGNTELSERTTAQAASLEETASSMEEITAVVRSTADGSTRASRLASDSSAVAGQGREAVQEVVRTMNAIATDSSAIASIVDTIDSIAFQTNILALNAAVEAARAGEAGRSFAVVAAEVGALAKRSATAAREINALIENSLARVKAGLGLAETAGVTIEKVVNSVQQLVATVADISAANQEQSASLEQINAAITQMEGMTQQNATLVEQVAGSSRLVEDMSLRTLHAVSAFKLQGGASAAHAGASPPVAAAIQPTDSPPRRVRRHAA